MPQSLAKIYIHTVFSTKQRRPYFKNIELRGELHSYLGGVAKNLDCSPIRVGGVDDHVHLLTTLSRTITVADFVKEIKRVSAVWVKQQNVLEEFRWQAGYGVFSVSQSQLLQIVDYIDNQSEHHAKFDFQTEFRELLRRHHLAFDERYVWD